MTGTDAGNQAPGRPRRWALAREGIAAATTQPVATAVAALITAAVCTAILATTGQSAAAEARVLSQIDHAGARTLVFTDPTGRAGLVAAGLDAVAALAGVEWVTGVGPVTDIRTDAVGRAGQPVPARPIYTDLPPAITVIHGRAPAPGEAVAGTDAITALGLADGAGTISGAGYTGPIVATFTATDPLTGFDTGVLTLTEPNPDRPMRTVHVVAASIDDVATLEDAVPALLTMTDPFELVTESPAQLVDLQRVVAGELGESSRQLMLLVLAVGLVLIAVTLYGATANRRRDFGRRRALGASRTAIVTLVLTQTSLAALAGALLGTGAGLAIVQTLEGTQPAWTFTTGVATLTVLTALAAAIPPALAAATRDPVRILRVP